MPGSHWRGVLACVVALSPLAGCGAGGDGGGAAKSAQAPSGVQGQPGSQGDPGAPSAEALASGPSEPARARPSEGPSWVTGETVAGDAGAVQGQMGADAPAPSLLECLLDRPVFRSFAAMLLVTELEEELAGEPYTVFVPNDMAFQLLSLERRLELFEVGDLDLMADVVRRHVVRGLFSAADVAKAGQLTTLAGTRIRIDDIGGLPMVDGAQLLSSRATDVGMMHEIDRVLLP